MWGEDIVLRMGTKSEIPCRVKIIGRSPAVAGLQ